MSETKNLFSVGMISIFPEMFEALQYGVVGRAIKSQQVSIKHFNPRDFSMDKHGYIDDRPYGGGPGMVMQAKPLMRSIEAAKQNLGDETKVIYLSPQGKTLSQSMLKQASIAKALIFVAGRYEGIDQRVVDSHIDEQWSIGDYVLSGGELAAMVVVDGIVRLLPNVLGHDESAEQDSFSCGLLDHPHYTRPECIEGKCVPEVLVNGDHRAIMRWRMQQALGNTWLNRPDLLEKVTLSEEQRYLLNEFKRVHVRSES